MMDSEFVEELEEDEEEEFNVEEHLALAEAYRAEQKKNAEENNLHQVCCLNCGLKKYVTEEIKNKGYYYCVGSCMGF
jgi:carbamoylphosphate synthase small subunit